VTIWPSIYNRFSVLPVCDKPYHMNTGFQQMRAEIKIIVEPCINSRTVTGQFHILGLTFGRAYESCSAKKQMLRQNGPSGWCWRTETTVNLCAFTRGLVMFAVLFRCWHFVTEHLGITFILLLLVRFFKM